MKKICENTVEYQRFCNCQASENDRVCSDKYEIFYVKSGDGCLICEGTCVTFTSGAFFVIKPLTLYSLKVNDSENDEIYHFSFAKSGVSVSVFQFVEALFPSNECCASITEVCSDEISRILSGLAFLDNLSGEAREQYLSAIIVQILVLLSSAKTKISYSSSDDFTLQVADYISDELENNRVLSLDEIAKAFLVSKFYLCRAFKSHNGISIHSYINRKRIMKAKQYMDEGMSAKDASAAVGYADYSAFYRAYVKVAGKSPTQKRGE